MTTPSQGAGAVRSHLIDALEADLVSPFLKPPGAAVSDAPEVLRISPSGWYLTGFLVPRDQGEMDAPEDGDLEAGNDEDNKVRRLPASMGLSVFIPLTVRQLTAHGC